ncbi:hypothetical protein [Lacticaseibacillus saniviri]|uniref:hypothetical protein n=1 Tax=Lacticaseibacillus saniviri TaxID=931533 RepID=UPI001EDE6599|nr:hypothetical protein [Lacticaseibacillus saniviri]MCG4281115.1 hypothetical protein [Lacticaseibacillus saniviri]
MTILPQHVHAAWMAPISEVPWSTSSVPYTGMFGDPPTLADGSPGFIPYDAYFHKVGPNSVLIKSPDGTHNAGLAVTTAGQNEVGALWSNSPVFNLDKQHLSVSMAMLIKQGFNYSGYIPGATPADPGDGMAFALTGSSIPTDSSKMNTGASVGVWRKEEISGAKFGSTPTLPADTNQLKKSAVITFDTYANLNTLDYNAYPSGSTATNASYVGFNYPDQAGTYTVGADHYRTDTSNWYWPVHLMYDAGTQTNSSTTTLPRPFNTGVSLLSKSSTLNNNYSLDKWHILDVTWDHALASDPAGGGTLTYRLTGVQTNADGSDKPLVRRIRWTDAQINTIFGTHQLSVGFTGSTGSQFEANVFAFRSLPGWVNAGGYTSLTKKDDSPAEITPANAANPPVLKTNDQLKYNFTVTFDNDSLHNWSDDPQSALTAVVPINKYFVFPNKNSSESIDVTYPDGTTGTADATILPKDSTHPDNRYVKVTGINSFKLPSTSTSGTQKLTFNMRIDVDQIPTSEIAAGATKEFTDDTATVSGDTAQIHLENQAQTTNPYSIHYQIQNNNLPYNPPADPTLDSVPSLTFVAINTDAQIINVSDLINGTYTRSVKDQSPKKVATTNDLNPLLTADNNQYFLLATANYNKAVPTNSLLQITGNNAKQWDLQLSLSNFALSDSTGKVITDSNGDPQTPLPQRSTIAFISTTGGSNSPANYWPGTNLASSTETSSPKAMVKDDGSGYILMNAQSAASLKYSGSFGSNFSTDGGFTMESGDTSGTSNPTGTIYSILGFDGKMPTVKVGHYTSTATWTLSTTPTS